MIPDWRRRRLPTSIYVPPYFRPGRANQSAENSLALLLAETPHKIQRGKLGNQQLPENFSVGVPLQMLANRPDVRSAEFSLAQAFYTTNAARAAFYPSITLSGSAGWTNSAGSMIVNPGKFLLRRGFPDAAFV